MLQRYYNENRFILDKIIFLTLFILFLFLFVKVLFPYTAPFVVGFVISLILEPFVKLFEKYVKIGRGIVTFFLLLILLLSLTLLGTSLVSRIFHEAKMFLMNLPSIIQSGNELFADVYTKYKDFLEFIPPEFEKFINDSISTVSGTITSFVANTLKNSSVNFVVFFPNMLMFFILTVISAFFFTKDKKLIREQIAKIAPLWLTGGVKTVKTGLTSALIGYIKAQLIIMSLTGAICILGLTILRFPYAFFVGVIIAVFDALPIFGSGAIFWPWALFALVLGDYRYAIGLMIIYGCVFLSRQFLEPKVLSSQIGIHPLLTLISIFAGYKLFGVMGFFIGPLIMVISKLILERGPSLSPMPDYKDPPSENEADKVSDATEA